MTNEEVLLGYLRTLGAELHTSNLLALARDMFGKGYFALGQVEKIQVDRVAWELMWSNYHALQPQAFAAPSPQPELPLQGPLGFAPPEA